MAMRRMMDHVASGPIELGAGIHRAKRPDVCERTEYGLSAAVFGRDIARALEVAKRIESGICHINGPTLHDEAQMPFGGVKASGYGASAARRALLNLPSYDGSPSKPVHSITRFNFVRAGTELIEPGASTQDQGAIVKNFLPLL